jgi:hypothetical protein
LGYDDVFANVKVGMWGNRVYVVGYTNSFNDQDDSDGFLMRLTHELELVYIKMMVNDGYSEVFHDLVLGRA